MKFADLFTKYGTLKEAQMHYGPIYDRLLDGRRIRTILEIGVKEGFSLLAWSEAYPEAEIYGLDISLAKTIQPVREHPRIRLVQGDSTDPTLVPEYFRFDLIVDDGSHRVADQLATLKLYGPTLLGAGIYVIEDIDSDANMDTLIRAAKDMNYEVRGLYSDPAPGIRDNRLVVIEP